MLKGKTFDTRTVQGLKAAETYKAKLENEYNKVTVIPIGFNLVRIVGLRKKMNRG